MPEPRAVCVFCGSSPGVDPRFLDAARRVGRSIANAGLVLVYGGGRVGLMGAVADAALERGGRVVGIIPESLAQREVAHGGLSELHVVDTMHTRKAMMASRSDAFLTLPGGLGTYEEFFEVATWAVLGIHQKPLGLLNVEGYFDPLIRLIDHAVESGFSRPAHRQMILVGQDPERIAVDLLAHRPDVMGPKWATLDEV